MKTDVQFELSKILRSCIDLKKKTLWITKQISLQYLFLAILTMADPILYSLEQITNLKRFLTDFISEDSCYRNMTTVYIRRISERPF